MKKIYKLPVLQVTVVRESDVLTNSADVDPFVQDTYAVEIFGDSES